MTDGDARDSDKYFVRWRGTEILQWSMVHFALFKRHSLQAARLMGDEQVATLGIRL